MKELINGTVQLGKSWQAWWRCCCWGSCYAQETPASTGYFQEDSPGSVNRAVAAVQRGVGGTAAAQRLATRKVHLRGWDSKTKTSFGYSQLLNARAGRAGNAAAVGGHATHKKHTQAQDMFKRIHQVLSIGLPRMKSVALVALLPPSVLPRARYTCAVGTARQSSFGYSRLQNGRQWREELAGLVTLLPLEVLPRTQNTCQH
jgi:hypothetical protein